MFNQHAKWLKVTAGLAWRRKIASLNYLLRLACVAAGSQWIHASRPGSSITWSTRRPRSCAFTCRRMRTVCCRSWITVCAAAITSMSSWRASIRPPQWLSMDAAIKHCSEGIGIWQWASNDQRSDPDLVLACAGDVPTLETLAAVSILRQQLQLKVRVVYHRSDETATAFKASRDERQRFRRLFTTDKPVIFAFRVPLARSSSDLPPAQS